MDEKNKSNNFISKNNGETPKMKLSFNECNNNRYNYNFSYDLKIVSKDSNRVDSNKSNNKKNFLNKKSQKRNISTNFRNSKKIGNFPSKNRQIKKSVSQNKIISGSKDKKDNVLYEKEAMDKMKFPLKKEKDEEEKNLTIKIIMNSNSKDYAYRHKNTNSNNNYYMTNKIFFLSPNNYSNNNNNRAKKFSLKSQKNSKKNKNIFKLGKFQNPKSIRDNQNNNLNLFYNNETKNINIHGKEKIFLNSLRKTNIKNPFNLNKNDIKTIKEEKEFEQKKEEELNNSNLSEKSHDFLNCDESNLLSKNKKFNSYKKEKSNNKISISKVEIKTETNLDKLYHVNKDKNKNKTTTKQNTNYNKRNNKFNSLKNHKNKQLETSFNKNNHALRYPKRQKRNRTTSSKNMHQNRICFIMNGDIISDNKNYTIISAGTKLKKNKNNLIQNLGKFTNDTEINKIQDILSNGDKTFSELAYDKGLSDVVNQIPSPNSHRGSKDAAPKSIKNPNENYGPFKSLFSVGLDKRDESSISSSPCYSRSNSSSRVVKNITSLQKKKFKNLKKSNYTNLIEDEKEKINKNNFIEENNINENDKDNNIVSNEEKECDNYPDTIWSEEDNELSSKLKNDLINEVLSSKYNTFINKLIKGVEEKNNKKNMNININQNDVQKEKENKLKEFEKDYKLLSQMTSEFEKLEENYNNECGKINDKIFRINRVSNFILQQSFPNNPHLQNSILSFAQSLEKIDNQYNNEVKKYKKTIQSLIDQLGGTEDCIDKKLLKEAKDIQLSERQIFETFLENKNTSNDKNSQNLEKQELIKELEHFKHEEKEYKFSIPEKYSLDISKTKLLKKGIIKGLFVKVYENKVIDIINKHGTTKRIFPDGFQISFYNNKDIKLRFNNKDEFCLYHVNQAEEFRFPSKGIIIYKFKNGQFEKHYSNYELNIKFSDGSYRIIRKEKELFQYPDGILEFKDKKGNKSYMDI